MLFQKIERQTDDILLSKYENHASTFSYLLNISGNRNIPDQKEMSVRLINTDEQRELVEHLINRMYSWRGYGSDHSIPATENCRTFAAYSGDDPVGTLTLTIDSPYGLAADATFHQNLETYRQRPGSRICELSKFAFDTSAPSKLILAALFHSIFIYGSRFNCTDLFIEVNPRHRRFYETMLGFKRIGDLKTNASVCAPSQLMWISVSDIRENIEGRANYLPDSGRSLYPLFFLQAENSGADARPTVLG